MRPWHHFKRTGGERGPSIWLNFPFSNMHNAHYNSYFSPPQTNYPHSERTLYCPFRQALFLPSTRACRNNNEQLDAMKSFQTDIKRVEVVESLSKNPDLVISSSSNDEVNAMMMCDAVLTNVQPGKPLNRSQVCITHKYAPKHTVSVWGFVVRMVLLLVHMSRRSKTLPYYLHTLDPYCTVYGALGCINTAGEGGLLSTNVQSRGRRAPSLL